MEELQRLLAEELEAHGCRRRSVSERREEIAAQILKLAKEDLRLKEEQLGEDNSLAAIYDAHQQKLSVIPKNYRVTRDESAILSQILRLPPEATGGPFGDEEVLRREVAKLCAIQPKTPLLVYDSFFRETAWHGTTVAKLPRLVYSSQTWQVRVETPSPAPVVQLVPLRRLAECGAVAYLERRGIYIGAQNIRAKVAAEAAAGDVNHEEIAAMLQACGIQPAA